MISVDGIKANLVTWDTAGSEGFKTLAPSHYRSVQDVILVYNVTRSGTLLN